MPEPLKDDVRSQPVVENKAAQPSGILPKNTQAMVIAGISLTMVAAIAFSGTSSKGAAKPAVPVSATVIDPNQTRIAEYRQRLDEQARKLAAEQAQFVQAKQQFGAATGIQNGSSSSTTNQPGDPRTEEDTIENDRKRRNYLSLYASSVALSYRKESQSAQPAVSVSQPTSITSNPGEPLPSLAATPTPYGYMVPFATSGVPAVQPDTGPVKQAKGSIDELQRSEDDESNPATKSNKDRFAELNQSEGKNYRLFEGAVLETVLTNRLTGSFAGPVNCMVTTNVYSHDRQHLLIPQGSRVLGEVKRVSNFGQDRLAVVFHRLIMPDGYSVSLDQFKGLNQIGETGLRDQVNHHYAQIFGVSLALGAIAGLAQADTASGINQSSTDAYRQGVAGSLSQSALHILDRFLNVLPTLTIREGHRVKVYLSDDLLVPAYENHHMPEDL